MKSEKGNGGCQSYQSVKAQEQAMLLIASSASTTTEATTEMQARGSVQLQALSITMLELTQCARIVIQRAFTVTKMCIIMIRTSSYKMSEDRNAGNRQQSIPIPTCKPFRLARIECSSSTTILTTTMKTNFPMEVSRRGSRSARLSSET